MLSHGVPDLGILCAAKNSKSGSIGSAHGGPPPCPGSSSEVRPSTSWEPAGGYSYAAGAAEEGGRRLAGSLDGGGGRNDIHIHLLRPQQQPHAGGSHGLRRSEDFGCHLYPPTAAPAAYALRASLDLSANPRAPEMPQGAAGQVNALLASNAARSVSGTSLARAVLGSKSSDSARPLQQRWQQHLSPPPPPSTQPAGSSPTTSSMHFPWASPLNAQVVAVGAALNAQAVSKAPESAPGSPSVFQRIFNSMPGPFSRAPSLIPPGGSEVAPAHGALPFRASPVVRTTSTPAEGGYYSSVSSPNPSMRGGNASASGVGGASAVAHFCWDAAVAGPPTDAYRKVQAQVQVLDQAASTSTTSPFTSHHVTLALSMPDSRGGAKHPFCSTDGQVGGPCSGPRSVPLCVGRGAMLRTQVRAFFITLYTLIIFWGWVGCLRKLVAPPWGPPIHHLLSGHPV